MNSPESGLFSVCFGFLIAQFFEKIFDFDESPNKKRTNFIIKILYSIFSKFYIVNFFFVQNIQGYPLVLVDNK